MTPAVKGRCLLPACRSALDQTRSYAVMNGNMIPNQVTCVGREGMNQNCPEDLVERHWFRSLPGQPAKLHYNCSKSNNNNNTGQAGAPGQRNPTPSLTSLLTSLPPPILTLDIASGLSLSLRTSLWRLLNYVVSLKEVAQTNH